jgi:hypothetical protein
VDGDEVALPQQLLQAHQADTELGGAGRLHVRVVRDQPGPEGGHALREQDADAAETDHADGLALDLDAGVLGALPLPRLEGGAGARRVPCDGEQQRDGLLGGGDDVGRGRVDHHHAARGGRGDLHVVQAHAGPGHHLEPRRHGDRRRVDLRGAAHDDRVGVLEGAEQSLAVRAVHVPHVEIVGEHVDRGGRELFGDEYNGSHQTSMGVVGGDP